MDWAAAAVGAIPGLGALGWNVYEFRKSGPSVDVKASMSMPIFGTQMGDPHIQVEATNTGRAPVTLQGWGIALPGDRSIVMFHALPYSTPLPHRLEPHSSASFFVEVAEIQRGRRETGVPFSQMRPFVSLATGEKRYAKRVPLDESWAK